PSPASVSTASAATWIFSGLSRVPRTIMYASMPGIGLMPADSHADRRAHVDAIVPWSVIATAGLPSAAADCAMRSTVDRPSNSEYSEWVWRWTNWRSVTRVSDPWWRALGTTLSGRRRRATVQSGQRVAD